ncbi:short-chain dehydrogenase/reductase SDR family protein [Rhodotorula toruloides]|uniref:Short-chain dehydrogenase/reductase SDR family protein n=1 Tax=Rhodotorula toruloides TaxID=5286 RepID=A0A511KJJ1_RHOTO|nr:short-chain dehydrogenase/reductase SDR family protein [Rhodotorula toruloides]
MAAQSTRNLAVVVGAGPGLGASLARAFAKRNHAVAVLARSEATVRSVAEDIRNLGGDAAPFACDVTRRESLDAAFAAIKKQWPDHQLKAALFNANSPFIMKPFLELKEEDVKPGVDVNFYGAFHFAQVTIPLMLEAGGGFLGITGATAALKGSAKFAALAPGKFALRGLAQNLAREFGPQGIHVSHVIVDGIIETERVKGMMGEAKQPDSRLQPDAIADTYVHLAEQPRNCWAFELDLRPSVEKW